MMMMMTKMMTMMLVMIIIIGDRLKPGHSLHCGDGDKPWPWYFAPGGHHDDDDDCGDDDDVDCDAICDMGDHWSGREGLDICDKGFSSSVVDAGSATGQGGVFG